MGRKCGKLLRYGAMFSSVTGACRISVSEQIHHKRNDGRGSQGVECAIMMQPGTH